MVTVGSVILLLITIFGLGFDGYERQVFNIRYFFLQETNIYRKYQTNWLGVIAIVNITISIVGFFLFKDKK